MKFLVGIFLIALGYIIIRYSAWLVDNIGIRIAFLEINVGPGTTYSAVKVAGLGVIVFGLWYMFN